ncbi:hypothetical protein N0V90_009811 [Kalmusia sp. IMI 367209]|nr:hypothetical protein N0V90_009811 [Kalmusia sp. IMI 367209]
MPPKAAPARRKGPAFNPPRPIKPATSTGTTKGASNAGPSRSAGGAKPSAARSSFQPATTIISSDEEQDNEFDDMPSDLDALIEDVLEEQPRPRRPALDMSTPPIPTPLLVNILHHNFEDEDVQIQKGAMKLFENYMTIFVREAMARAKSERDDAGRHGGASNQFLQVEDLEKLAPQLVLDF